MSTLNIGKAIYALLSGTTCNTLINGAVFPCIAEEDTKYPYMIYNRTSLIPQNNKDYTNEQIFVDFICVSDKYAQSVDVVEKLREALEHKSGNYGGFSISDITVTNASEDWFSNAYIQNLSIRIDLKD